MKTLIEYINESLLDKEEDIMNRVSAAQIWVDQLKSNTESNFNNNDNIQAEDNGTVHLSGATVNIDIDIPEFIKITANENTYVVIQKTVENLESLSQLEHICFDGPDVKIEKSWKNPKNVKDILIRDCSFDDYSWLPKSLESLSINVYMNVDCKLIDLKNTYIETIEINRHPSLVELKNINCDTISIQNSSFLKTLANVKAETLKIKNCQRFTEFSGKSDVEVLWLDSTCKKINIDTLPKTLTNIYGARSFDQNWQYSNLINICPKLDQTGCQLPLDEFFKALNDPNYKPGAWVVVRGAHKASGPWGTTRGELGVDKIKKISKNGGITTEHNGARSYCDFEIMRDANLHKDWNYVNPDGVNDITGVGIQVGDEVVVYCASGSFGKNNGIEVDRVVQVTKARVKCENNGLRKPEDICILRSQKLCDKQFK